MDMVAVSVAMRIALSVGHAGIGLVDVCFEG